MLQIPEEHEISSSTVLFPFQTLFVNLGALQEMGYFCNVTQSWQMHDKNMTRYCYNASSSLKYYSPAII